MGALDDLNEDKAVAAISERYVPRLEKLTEDPAEREQNLELFVAFVHIALMLVKQEPTVTMPDGSVIDIDKAQARKIVMLFSEGILFALSRCISKRINGEPRIPVLQAVALDTYNQSKLFAYSREEKDVVRKAHLKAIDGYLKEAVMAFEQQNGPIPGRVTKANP